MNRFTLFITILSVAFVLTTPMSASAATRSLSLGLSGTDVTALQNTLIAQGYLASGKNTGYFGPLTQAAVQKFQCAQSIVCSGTTQNGYGVYGPKTQAALAQTTIYPKNPSTNVNAVLTPAATGAFEISGWIPYWRTEAGVADVTPHIAQLTSVMPFGYTIKSDGTLYDAMNITEEPWTTFIKTARDNNVRIIPTVMWGNGNAIHATLSNTKTRIALEDEIAAMVYDNGFDGVDIDFEAKQHETINYFSTFLKGLAMRLPDKFIYCTIEARMPLENRYSPGANIPADATDYANDYIAMNEYCDRVEIMAYDQGTIDVRLNAARGMPYAPVADPEWVEELVTLAAQTISRNKLILGIPTYGYEYAITPSDSGFTYKVLWPFNPRYATEIAERLGITPTRTSAGEMGFIYSEAVLTAPVGDEATGVQQTTLTSTTTQSAGTVVNATGALNYMTWSDAGAIADKVALARRLGLRGVAVFKFDGGEDQGMWGVLK